MTGMFDPDALLAALPRRSIRRFSPDLIERVGRRPAPPVSETLHLKGSYNGFTSRERSRTAVLFKLDREDWLRDTRLDLRHLRVCSAR